MTCNQLETFGIATRHAELGPVTGEAEAYAPTSAAGVPSGVRDEIQRLAVTSAESEIGELIATTFVRFRVDWKNVPLEEMKKLVVATTLAVRRRTS